ncbi:MAG: regulatory protein RecX [Solirubrobacteraceae bacterium]
MTVAYRFINRREHTEMEVRTRLARAGFSAEEIEQAVLELVGFGYVDDVRYARLFVHDRRVLDSWGRARIARSLSRHGVSRPIIAQALGTNSVDDRQAAACGGDRDAYGADAHGNQSDGEGELERAVALLDRRFPQGPQDRRDRGRAFGMLARKGYDGETAGDAVRRWSRHTAA